MKRYEISKHKSIGHRGVKQKTARYDFLMGIYRTFVRYYVRTLYVVH
jgi:hypothetical protein